MSKNGMASYQKTADYVNLTRLPTPKTEYSINFEKLTGGLNLYDPDYRLKLNESPDMENMLWKNGTLCSRYGQSYLNSDTTRGAGYTCFHELFWGRAFFHIGDGIWYGIPGNAMTLTKLCDLSTFYEGYVAARGTFLRYGDDLYYKAPGVFVGIHYDGSSFTARDVAASAYTPVTFINASWRDGSGTAYQPENRLSSRKTLWYNAGTDSTVETLTGDGSTTEFALATSGLAYVSDVTVNGETVGNWLFSGGTLRFYTAPANGAVIRVTCETAVRTYHLPVKGSGVSIVSAMVDGVSAPYTFDASTGVVTFETAPPVTQPLSSNTVRITYSMDNPDAYASIMDCPYAIVYGGNQNICMVVGGCTAQPNAFFWNGNNVAMDVSYWPMEQYNLGGDTEDEITGFGRQQGYLVVFKKHSVGKGEMQFTTVDQGSVITARTYIEIDYTNINSRIGCDLPWTIQLINNNLVFCNTEQGVHIILDSSAAYENNVVDISRKVNGMDPRTGLLHYLRTEEEVSGFDDNHRYWVIAGTRVYCWDYELSVYKDPSWFYLTGIDAPALMMDVETIYHLDSRGRIVVFDRSYADFGQGFARRYQFATQYFRTYDRLKTVTNTIFTLRADTSFTVNVLYLTDYESRKDLTDLTWISTTSLVPRDLTHRAFLSAPFAYVARRRPGCRHVRHFSMALTCVGPGQDMPILSAQVFYKYEGRDR